MSINILDAHQKKQAIIYSCTTLSTGFQPGFLLIEASRSSLHIFGKLTDRIIKIKCSMSTYGISFYQSLEPH